MEKLKMQTPDIVEKNIQQLSRIFPQVFTKLNSEINLLLETKGKDNEQNKTKRTYINEWCRTVNLHGGFGKWRWAVSYDPNDLPKMLEKN